MISIVWLGLYLGIAHTAPVQTPLLQPGLTMDITAVVGIGKVSARVLYLQPLQKDGYGPAVQVGVGVRVF